MTTGKPGLALGDAVRVGSGDERPICKELVMGTVSSNPILRSDWGWLPLTRKRKIWEEFPRKPEADQSESSGSQESFRFGARLGGGGESCRRGGCVQMREAWRTLAPRRSTGAAWDHCSEAQNQH